MAETPKQTAESESLTGIAERFSPGELTAQEGNQTQDWGQNRENIPEKYQGIFKELCKKIAKRDMFARIEEVKRAAEQRFYWRNMMDVCWNETSALWEIPYNGQLFRDDKDAGDIELHYPFNIYQAKGRGFISIVGQIPEVKVTARKLDSPFAQRIAASGEALKEKIEDQNDPDQFAEDVGRLMWTDGRVSFYSRWVTDGARFGYEDGESDEESQAEGIGGGGDPPPKQPRRPRGGEVITPYGVLECKVPINMRSQSDFPWRQLSFEIDLTEAKSIYPWIGERLKGGEPGPGEFNFDRTTRIACTQGVKLLTQSGDTVNELPTWQRTWMRPSFLAAEIENDVDRAWFLDNYPDGALVAFVGESYAESRNESMDAHWKDCRPIPGDGQATPSAGEIIMPVQDAVCDLTDLRMETYMKSIQSTWVNTNAANLAAISKQKAGPGAYRALELAENVDQMGHMFFVEPAPELPQDAIQFSEELVTSLPDMLTGLYPAALGESDAKNETLGGIKLLGQASKGQAGVAWKAFRKAYAGAMAQLIRIGAYFRAAQAKDGILQLETSSGNVVNIELEDLHDGNWACVPEGDESYPRTHSEKVQAYEQFVALAGKTPQGLELIFEPKNLVMMKDLSGLDIEIPRADSEEKQLDEIKQLLSETPIPNQEVALKYRAAVAIATQSGQPIPPQPPPEQMYQPSVPIDVEYDDHQAEYTAMKDFLNSAQGQQAKRENPDGFMNCRLHGLLHKQQMDKAQQAQVAQTIQAQAALAKVKEAAKPAKTPAESINFKDLGPSGRVQVGKQAGLDLTADEGANLAEEAMGGNPHEQAQPKPNGKPQ